MKKQLLMPYKHVAEDNKQFIAVTENEFKNVYFTLLDCF